ncbi:MAG: methylenetetrahydrofolate reductase [NAD(P)H] [Hyphomicrobiales bacterium]
MTLEHAADAPDEPEIKASFEFFPPSSEAMEETLWNSVKRLQPIRPQFVSVTYGAGGSTRERTHATIERIVKETDLEPAAHLTCVAAPRSEVDAVVNAYHGIGVRHIVALRGDPPDGVGNRYEPHPDGYQTTAELVAGIKKAGPFEVSVSAYPEKHPESADFETDLAVLAAKVDAGATRAITQFFFDNTAYFRFVDRVRARGIDVPIIPGILPVSNFEKIVGFAEKCGAAIPATFARRFEGLEDDPEARKLVAAAVAAEQVSALREQGVTEFHFYTLNRAALVYAMCRLLGLGAPDEMAAA